MGSVSGVDTGFHVVLLSTLKLVTRRTYDGLTLKFVPPLTGRVTLVIKPVASGVIVQLQPRSWPVHGHQLA